MTVLMDNAHDLLSPAAPQAVTEQRLHDVLYADDTLIIGTDVACVEELALAIEKAGAEFGMTLQVCIGSKLKR